MTINFKLSDVSKRISEEDPMSRTWVGWAAGTPDQQTYEQNRGVWSLGRRAHKESVATFSHGGVVITVVGIEGIEDIPSLDGGKVKQAIIGKVLAAGDPDYDALIGKPVDAYRNPVTYSLHPLEGTRTCACGCGAEVAGNRSFLPGHDQRAIHDRIAQGWGTTLGFVEWFDETHGAPSAVAVARTGEEN